MKMRDLVVYAENFARNRGDMTIEFSRTPWRPSGAGFQAPIPLRRQTGIYVFCRDVEGDDASAETSEAEVWYVGKANSAQREPIAARVFQHFGLIYHPVTKQLLDFFNFHRWSKSTKIPEEFRKAIEQRKCLIYTAAVAGGSPTLPEELESFLLHTINDQEGLPPLNTVLPRRRF